MPGPALKGRKTNREGVTPYFRQNKNTTATNPTEVPPCIFNGKTEEEILQMKLPDRLANRLDIVFVGINPGLKSASVGHHYAGRNNHFWPCLRDSGLLPDDFSFDEDFKSVLYGIGLTNIVERTTRTAADLSRAEIKDGIEGLINKLAEINPLLICFNGKGIFEIFTGKKCQLGLQHNRFPKTNALIYVMPSTSGRTITHPRRQDKLVFFNELRRLRDELKGMSDSYMDDID